MMCACCLEGNKVAETKPERPKMPPPTLWEEEVAQRTEGLLPPGYHIEHCRFGADDRTGVVAALDTRNKRAAEILHKDYAKTASRGFAIYREAANSLVKKAWKNFLKKGY